MENEVGGTDGDVTQRRTWSAAEAAMHPALAIRPSKSLVPPLERIPRGSIAPPITSETAVSPAPCFDDAGQRVDAQMSHVPVEMSSAHEVLDDIVELSSAMLVDEDDDEIELLADDLVADIDDEVVELDPDVIEEIDSGLMAYVETRGEFTDRPHKAPSHSDVSSVSLSSLHETVHSQALATGMAMYSDGVPSHSLTPGSSRSTTLRIRRLKPFSKASRASTTRSAVIASVFLMGVGAGVFLGLSSASSQAPSTQAVISQSHAIPAPVVLAEVAAEPSAGATAPNELDVNDSEDYVVAPLVESEAQEDQALQAESDIDVRPLDVSESSPVPAPQSDLTDAPAHAKTEPEAVVRNDVHALPSFDKRVVATPDVRVVAKREKRAHIKNTTDLPPSLGGTANSGDPGVLMLGAKPPCEIRIDGKDTGLTTPQRVLRLPPGKHKVTLVNEEYNLRDSFPVSIRSGKKTRVVRDMTGKIK